MNVVLFGATGMVGSGVLRECIEEPRVASILVVGRSSVGLADPKIEEILHSDFLDFAPIQARFAGGYPRPIVETEDINRLAELAGTT